MKAKDMKKTEWLSGTFLIVVLKTFFTIFAFMFGEVYPRDKSIFAILAGNDEYAGILWCSLALFLLFFYCADAKKQSGLTLEWAILAAGFSVFILIGRSFSEYNSWELVFASWRQLMFAMLAAVGWWFLFYDLLKRCFFFLNEKCRRISPDTTQKSEKRLYILWFVVILLGWLPYIAVFFPGNVPHDGMYQLSMWFGYDKITNHHPYFSTLLFGILMRIGMCISDNAGIFLIVLVQSVVCASIYAYLSVRVKRYIGVKWGGITALFFAIVPMWGSYAASVIKDTLFYAVFALYFCHFIDIFELNVENGEKKIICSQWLRFLLLSFLVCLIRNDGIYRIFPAMAVLWVAVSRRKKKSLFAIAAILVIILSGYNYAIFHVLGVEKGNSREMLSIPVQQTARYVRDSFDDMTVREVQAVYSVMPLERLGKLYNEELSDPIKNKVNISDGSALKQYVNAWFSMGLRHPGIYIQATLNNTYGYIYPFRNSRVMGAYQNYIKGEPVNKGFDIYYLADGSTRSKLSSWGELWRVFPGISLLSNPGTYTWLVLIGIAFLIKKRELRELSVTVVLLLQIAICIASPVNGLLRYAMPLIASMPLFVAWTVYKIKT